VLDRLVECVGCAWWGACIANNIHAHTALTRARRDDFLGHVSLPMTEFYGKRTVDKYAHTQSPTHSDATRDARVWSKAAANESMWHLRTQVVHSAEELAQGAR
jgi:hypothetical protein